MRALLVLLVACGGAPEAGHTLADIQKRGEITWGGDVQGGEPYVYEDPADPKHLIGWNGAYWQQFNGVEGQEFPPR